MGRICRAALVIFFLACGLCAQDPACKTRSVTVGILDTHGVVPQDLTVNAFIARLGQKPLEITGARLYSGAKRVAILIDTSGSMRKDLHASGKSNLAYWVAADAIERLPKDVSIAVVGFSDHVHGTLDFSSSREQLADEIARRRKSAENSPHGRTALMDAVKYVIDHIPDAGPGDSIYVVTDGEENASRVGHSPLERELGAAGVRLSVFLMQDFLFNGELFPGTDEVLRLAKATGGTVIEIHPQIHGTGTSGTTENFSIPPERQQVITDELTVLYRQTARPYLFDLKLPSELKKPHKWKLEVADDQLRKSTYVFYPSEIFPCGTASKKP